jgi:methylated-DNA-[protein]-cysteine S-methyltransferase
MHYRLFDTSFGKMAIVFKQHKAIRILLPATFSGLRNTLQTQFPLALENSDGMVKLTDLICRTLDGENITIPMDFVDTEQVTTFQLKVLLAERSIPRGKAASYSWLARKAKTKAVRAAGSVLARNPWPIVVPCHRAVRKNRSIGQYQGGPKMKKCLLEMEGVEFEDENRVSVDCFLD